VVKKSEKLKALKLTRTLPKTADDLQELLMRYGGKNRAEILRFIKDNKGILGLGNSPNSQPEENWNKEKDLDKFPYKPEKKDL